ncbi:MAG: RHS repeat-associated core domain-containing protein, partial [Myxococcota bacterium]
LQPGDWFEYEYDGLYHQVLTRSAHTVTHRVGERYRRVQAITGHPDDADRHTYTIRAGGAPVAQVTRDFDAAGMWVDTRTRYLHADPMGSVEVITDETGAEVERTSYDAFGARRDPDWRVGVAPPMSDETERSYTGHRAMRDLELDLVDMRARVYDPRLGRFMQPDPLVSDPTHGQTFNRYAYVRNNPMRYIDPTGLSEDDARWKPPSGRSSSGAVATEGYWDVNAQGERVWVFAPMTITEKACDASEGDAVSGDDTTGQESSDTAPTTGGGGGDGSDTDRAGSNDRSGGGNEGRDFFTVDSETVSSEDYKLKGNFFCLFCGTRTTTSITSPISTYGEAQGKASALSLRLEGTLLLVGHTLEVDLLTFNGASSGGYSYFGAGWGLDGSFQGLNLNYEGSSVISDKYNLKVVDLGLKGEGLYGFNGRKGGLGGGIGGGAGLVSISSDKQATTPLGSVLGVDAGVGVEGGTGAVGVGLEIKAMGAYDVIDQRFTGDSKLGGDIGVGGVDLGARVTAGAHQP